MAVRGRPKKAEGAIPRAQLVAASHAKRLEAGWIKASVWLSPEAQAALSLIDGDSRDKKIEAAILALARGL